MSTTRTLIALAALSLPATASATTCYEIVDWVGAEVWPDGTVNYLTSTAELNETACDQTPEDMAWFSAIDVVEVGATWGDLPWFLVHEDDPVLAAGWILLLHGFDEDGLPVIRPDIVTGLGDDPSITLTEDPPEEPPAPWMGESFLTVDTANTDEGCAVEATLQVTGLDGTDAVADQFDVLVWGDHMEGTASLGTAEPFGEALYVGSISGGLAEVDGVAVVPFETDGVVYASRMTRSGETELAATEYSCICPPIHADFNDDGAVDVQDLMLLLAHWGGASDACDLNGDGIVGVADLMVLLTEYGQVGC
ncbi:MAG TPA: hypothetical protein DFR83_23095 [Deltaproteobacteria bacterium]|nr:hypothetical protein [Deltaproteobacteria bacterium]